MHTNNPFRFHARSGRISVRRPITPNDLIAEAQRLIDERFDRGTPLCSPDDCRRFLALKLSLLEREIFACLFLDNRHRMISFETLFLGTIDGATVHAREIVKRALALNAAAVILTHNHPSGVAEPSQADRTITERIVSALRLVDVRVLDHFVVAGGTTESFAERGWL